ncbi:MAG: prepilin peptidase [Saccharofermentanales bacterium]
MNTEMIYTVWGVLAGALFICLLAWVSITDATKRNIPNLAILIMLIIGILNTVIAAISGQAWWWYPTGTMIALPFLLLWLRGKMGAGDVKLMLACGLFLGLQASLLMAGLMLVILLVIAAYLYFKQTSLKMQIPLGPVIALACNCMVVVSMIFST